MLNLITEDYFWKNADWIDLAHQWRSFVTVIMILRHPSDLGYLLNS